MKTLVRTKNELLFEDGIDLYRKGFTDFGKLQLEAAASLVGIPDNAGGSRVWILMAEEAWEEAIPLLLNLVDILPEWWEPRLRLGEAIGEMGNVEKAMDYFDQADQLGAPSSLVLQYRIAIQLAHDNLDEVNHLLALPTNELSPDEHFDIATEVNFRQHVITLAETMSTAKTLFRALKLIKYYLTDQQAHNQLYANAFMKRFERSYLAMAINYEVASRTRDIRRLSYRKERRIARHLITLKSSDHRSYERLVRSLLASRFFLHAEIVVLRGIEKSKKKGILYLLHGHALAGQKKYEEAIQSYFHAETLGFYNEALLHIAAVQILIGKENDAETTLRKLNQSIKKNPLSIALECIIKANENASHLFTRKFDWNNRYWLHGKSLTRGEKIRQQIKSLFRMHVRGSIPLSPLGSPVPCHVCGKEGGKEFSPLYRNPLTGFMVSRCRHCGFIMTNPLPSKDELAKFYVNDYYKFDRERLLWYHNLTARLLIDINYYEDRFDWLKKQGLEEFEDKCGPAREVLDIGCSVGSMLFELQRRGWKCSGLDISVDVMPILAQQGFNTYCGSPETVHLPEQNFHFVHMAHVIEHVTDPLALLHAARKAVRPGGWLFLCTPCCRTPPAAFAGVEWFDDPTHVIFFDRPSLLNLIRRANFEPFAVHSPIGVRFDTNSKRWNREKCGTAIEDVLTAHDLGDVIWVLAKAV